MKRSLLFLAVAFTLCSFVAAAEASPRPSLPGVDRVLVEKGKHKLSLMKGDAVVREYSIALGSGGWEKKICQGDGRTPEGTYLISQKNEKSAYHRSLKISYPNIDDIARANKANCSPGGDIMIHGIKNGYGFIGAAHRLTDWTLGCMAVTDTEIEEIWKLVSVGTRVEIRR